MVSQDKCWGGQDVEVFPQLSAVSAIFASRNNTPLVITAWGLPTEGEMSSSCGFHSSLSSGNNQVTPFASWTLPPLILIDRTAQWQGPGQKVDDLNDIDTVLERLMTLTRPHSTQHSHLQFWCYLKGKQHFPSDKIIQMYILENMISLHQKRKGCCHPLSPPNNKQWQNNSLARPNGNLPFEKWPLISLGPLPHFKHDDLIMIQTAPFKKKKKKPF